MFIIPSCFCVPSIVFDRLIVFRRFNRMKFLIPMLFKICMVHLKEGITFDQTVNVSDGLATLCILHTMTTDVHTYTHTVLDAAKEIVKPGKLIFVPLSFHARKQNMLASLDIKQKSVVSRLGEFTV